MRLPLLFYDSNTICPKSMGSDPTPLIAREFSMNKIYKFERWLDRYNHIMELMRTIIPIITLILQIFIIINLLN